MIDNIFHSDLYTDPEQYEETPLRDRKSEVPNLERGRECVKNRAEFLRDVIALANTARLFGKPAYLIFGLDDNGNILDQEEYLQIYDENGVSPWERVRRQMGQLIEGHIKPLLPHWDLRHGKVNGKEVGYMLILPVPSPQNFQIRRRFPPRGTVKLLTKDQSWIRFGESKAELEKERTVPFEFGPSTYCYAEVPYVLPSLWLKYFNCILAERCIVKAQTIVPYQQLFTAGEDKKPLDEIVQKFLYDSTSRLLILEGAAGCGKTVFLRRLVAKWADAGFSAIEGRIKREEFLPPPNWIPVYFQLRFLEVNDVDSLVTQLIERINEWGGFWTGRKPSRPEMLFEYADLHWVICLDGFDEICSIDIQRKFWTVLRGFMRRFPGIRVVLTTRPDMPIPRELGELWKIALLDQEQILSFVSAFIEDFDDLDPIYDFLHSEKDLWQLCSIPLYLTAALQELTNLQNSEANENLEASSLVDLEMYDSAPTELGGDLIASSVNTNTSHIDVPKVDITEMILREPLEVETEQDIDRQHEVENDREGIPFRLGRLLYDVYQNLLRREVERLILSKDDLWRLWDGLGEMAIFMDGKRKNLRRNKTLEYFSSSKDLNYILGLGVFRRRRSGGWIGFNTELTKAFFAAAFLLPFIEEENYCDAAEYVRACKRDFQLRMNSLLTQITYTDIEPLFQEVNHE